MGHEVYACEWSADAAAKDVAHVFEPIDLKDRKKVLEFAERHSVDGVLSAADIGVPAAAYVAERLGLRFHPLELALDATNKYRMRRRSRDAGVPGPRFRLVETFEAARDAGKDLSYPLIIKPVDNWSSRGVRTVNEEGQLEKAFLDSLEHSFSKQLLLEEFMSGTEGSVEALVQNGRVFIMGVCDKVKSELPFRYDLQLNYPGRYTENQWTAIKDFIEGLVRGYGIENGIIHVEIMVQDDSVRLIEFALRGCGSNVISHLIPATTSFDVIEYLINSALGVDGRIEFPESKAGILKFIMLKPGRLKSLKGVEKVRESVGIVDFNIEKKGGEVIDIVRDGRSRPGYCIAAGETLTAVENMIASALEKLEIEYY